MFFLKKNKHEDIFCLEHYRALSCVRRLKSRCSVKVMANKNKMFKCLFIVVNAFRYTFLAQMHATSTKTNISTNHIRLKNPIWWDAHQLTI